jgi:hypothetical protein
MTHKRNMSKKVEKQLQNYLDEYAQRARTEKPTDVFFELNNKWTSFCHQVKRPLMKEAFAVAVTELNQTVNKLDQRKRSEKFWGQAILYATMYSVVGTTILLVLMAVQYF